MNTIRQLTNLKAGVSNTPVDVSFNADITVGALSVNFFVTEDFFGDDYVSCIVLDADVNGSVGYNAANHSVVPTSAVRTAYRAVKAHIAGLPANTIVCAFPCDGDGHHSVRCKFLDSLGFAEYGDSYFLIT